MDDTFGLSVQTNEFVSSGRLAGVCFPLGVIPLRHMTMTMPAYAEPHGSGPIALFDYTVCWVQLSETGERLCQYLDVKGETSALPAHDGRHLLLFTGEDQSIEICESAIELVRLPRSPTYSVSTIGLGVGWVETELETGRVGFLMDLSSRRLIERCADLGASSAYVSESSLLLKDFGPAPDGRPIRFRVFDVLDSPSAAKRLAPIPRSTDWIDVVVHDARTAFDASGQGIVYVTEVADSLEVQYVSLDSGSVARLGGIPYGRVALSNDGHRLIVIGDAISYYNVEPTTLVPLWSIPAPDGFAMRAELSLHGRYAALHFQRSASASRDLYVLDHSGAIVVQAASDTDARDRVQGLEFVGEEWLLEGTQYPNDPLLFNSTVTTRVVSLYRLPQ